jgi:FkbM family methyltransferase
LAPAARLRARRGAEADRHVRGPVSRAFFIEIGANDGETGSQLSEHIRETEWRGVMVEPAPDAFERLQRNYGALHRVALENAAISDRDGMVPFYGVAASEARAGAAEAEPSEWLRALGSLSREQLLSHAPLIADLERRITTTEVRALTLESLCRKHGVEGIDLLVVDAEGHDDVVVSQLDLERRRPRVIVYEHLHLPRTRREACRGRLENAGYECLEEFFDTHCVDASADERLRHVLRRLRPRLPPVYADADPDSPRP